MDTWRRFAGWVAVAVSTVISSLWAYWGIVENFHEGWYYDNFFMNVAMMFGQYLLIPIIFMLIAYLSIKWHKLGSILHIIIAVFFVFMFRGATFSVLGTVLVLPALGLALLYWLSEFPKKGRAVLIAIGIPLIIMIALGIPNGVRVATRYNDGNFSIRQVETNTGKELLWAPQGPGWPERGVNWHEASERCARLSEDGQKLLDEPVNIWRLPTATEVVHSMTRDNENAGGRLIQRTMQPRYEVNPKKETPLWNPHSKIIYWWTATEEDEDFAYVVVYN